MKYYTLREAAKTLGYNMERDLNGARGIFVKNVARALLVQPPV